MIDRKMPAIDRKKPITYGGFCNLLVASSVNKSTVIPPPLAVCSKKTQKTSPMRANHPSESIPKAVFGSIPNFAALKSNGDAPNHNDSDNASSFDDYQPVSTQELPNLEDFGGAQALLELHTEDNKQDDDYQEN